MICQTLMFLNANFFLYKIIYGGLKMPTSDNGLRLVNSFIEETGIEKMSLAAKYGVAKNVMIDILSGHLQSPKAHQVILRIIDDFKLR